MKNKGQAGEALIVIIVLILIVGFFAVGPLYNVWQKGLAGEAQLREAEWNRQIVIEEAEAELMSADLKRQADVIRAEGIAEANEIIATSITPEYIQWRWVEGLHDDNNEIIYVPTEANLPILEATRNLGE